MPIDPQALDDLIKAAKIGPRKAQKLRDANEAEQPESARGHGASAPVARTRGDL